MRVHVFISGFVQGVGFRYFLKRQARRLGLNGFARNTIDRRVEAVFGGEKEKLDEIIKICRKGAFLSEVENVEVKWESPQKDIPSPFEIIR
ncbi:MAG: acylphosphatase [Candidatus Levybacteria bacterium]|nr:acylphosphatase [Candidatus Levybacteria bacterium]